MRCGRAQNLLAADVRRPARSRGAPAAEHSADVSAPDRRSRGRCPGDPGSPRRARRCSSPCPGLTWRTAMPLRMRAPPRQHARPHPLGRKRRAVAPRRPSIFVVRIGPPMSYANDQWVATFVDRLLAMLVYAEPSAFEGFSLGARPDEPEPPVDVVDEAVRRLREHGVNAHREGPHRQRAPATPAPSLLTSTSAATSTDAAGIARRP